MLVDYYNMYSDLLLLLVVVFACFFVLVACILLYVIGVCVCVCFVPFVCCFSVACLLFVLLDLLCVYMVYIHTTPSLVSVDVR